MIRLIILSILIAILGGCAMAPKEPTRVLKPSTFAQLPGWQNDQQQFAIPALKKSCQRLLRRRSTKANWAKSCQAILAAKNTLTTKEARILVEANFKPYLITNDGQSEGVFTGYYEPVMQGSLEKTSKFKVPLYARPTNLIKVRLEQFSDDLPDATLVGKVNKGYLVPYDTRQQIARGSLIKEQPVLAWVSTDIERFFLQIQGSGRVMLSNQDSILLGYDSQNGHDYVPIGRVLVKEGKIPLEQVSMQSIKRWLNEHPKEKRRILNENPSFVFFRKLNTDQPIGGEGLPLTPGRSLAIDTDFIPYGSLLWLDTTYPDKNKFQRLMVAQDTGGAIEGVVRGDIFFGHGKLAEFNAGHMNSKGRYWILKPV